MESRLEPKQKANAHRFLEQDINSAHKLGEELLKKHIELASVLLVKAETNYAIVLLDDLNNTLTNNTVNDLKIKISETCYKTGIEIGFHLMLASDIWKHYKEKSEQVQEILRNSYVVQDKGFITPLQDLFVKGKLRPTKESVLMHMYQAEKNLKNANTHVNSAVVDVYWAVVDTAHAAVMASGQIPPSPEQLGDQLKILAKEKKINSRCPAIMSEIFGVAKDIIRKRKWEITGKEFDKYLEKAEFFQKEMIDYVAKTNKL